MDEKKKQSMDRYVSHPDLLESILSDFFFLLSGSPRLGSWVGRWELQLSHTDDCFMPPRCCPPTTTMPEV